MDKTLSANADLMIRSFVSAREEGVEECVQDVSARYRSNHNLAFTITVILKNKAVEALLDGSLSGDDALKQASGGKRSRTSAVEVKVRAFCKQYKHLERLNKDDTMENFEYVPQFHQK